MRSEKLRFVFTRGHVVGLANQIAMALSCCLCMACGGGKTGSPQAALGAGAAAAPPSAASSAPAQGQNTASSGRTAAANGGTSGSRTSTTSAAMAGAAAAAGMLAPAAAGASGSGATIAAGGGDAGSAGAPLAAGAAAQAGAAGQPLAPGPAGAAGAAGAAPSTSSFPVIMDPWRTGPYAVATMSGAGPSRNASVLYPRELGKDGLKHPIVVWDNGAGQTGLSIYGELLRHLASHGFAVYAAYSATDGGKELLDGLDWMIAQANMSGGMFYQKLDSSKTAAMGHSQGSIATFAIAGDPRLTTTIHLSGGTNPEIAEGHATLPNLHNPAAFLCGEEPGPGADGLTVGDTASPWCAYDFEHTTVPVFLAQIDGASHITAPGMTLGACAAWLRWQLMGDASMKVHFVGDDCTLCQRRNWMCKSKGLM